MKIAVYTIAKNEEKFAKRWAESCVDADYRVVGDTGSTDGTVSALHGSGVSVVSITILPWRFDFARNAVLAHVPADADLCITLDMDEVLAPGWRQAVEAAWEEGATRLRYHYVWNWSDDGKPLVQFTADRAHARGGYHWVHPVHETLRPSSGIQERYVTSAMEIHHHADDAKSRGQYLPLLKLATLENPQDDRCAHYYARELMAYGQFSEAIAEFRRHLSLPTATWALERSASYRFMGRCYEAEGVIQSARQAYLNACAECSNRESWYELAEFCRKQKDWIGGVWAAQQCMSLPVDHSSYISDPVAQGYGPYDVGAVCAWYAGMYDIAKVWMSKALEFELNDDRLLKNAEIIFDRRAA